MPRVWGEGKGASSAFWKKKGNIGVEMFGPIFSVIERLIYCTSKRFKVGKLQTEGCGTGGNTLGSCIHVSICMQLDAERC